MVKEQQSLVQSDQESNLTLETPQEKLVSVVLSLYEQHSDKFTSVNRANDYYSVYGEAFATLKLADKTFSLVVNGRFKGERENSEDGESDILLLEVIDGHPQCIYRITLSYGPKTVQEELRINNALSKISLSPLATNQTTIDSQRVTFSDFWSESTISAAEALRVITTSEFVSYS